ncbi:MULTISPECIES: ABC transporter permease [Burkholderia]|uniref:ABC transporter permease n=1 Tax=Burkholderia TaxID=32008 RepID=UPI0007536CC8|nr:MULTISPECIES: ABC transporter permease [Burkholderia]AOJ68933.1 ABC transporter permease [Burkholderia savannae]KVG37870.1 ABC transporter permease [Burkholderia sp. MSMB0265]KVG78194.1 ABC transporter permease [Burkholderia sp. MSMB2040]KVG97484.1 ABC transporter permease [Burkholderia sp. MSMB2041]KVH01483.1 ABC transporter permease [Burkholderia sp. MSMB2042]
MSASTNTRIEPPVRDEYEVALAPVACAAGARAGDASAAGENGGVAAPLVRRSTIARLRESGWLRKALIALVLIAGWEIAARAIDNDLLLPTFTATALAFAQGIANGELPAKIAASLSVLLRGYALGVASAFLLSALAATTRVGRDLLTMLTAMFNPLPSIALLPLALLWFGLGTGSLLFVLVHAVLWPLALNTFAGFQAVPATLRMVGRNYGLTGVRHVVAILIPAALPSILAGLRVGWAFAWRTLIAAELVFGASAGGGGLGWYIFQNRNELYTDRVFAGLAAVIVIGLVVEHGVFDALERATVRRWGVHAQ